MSGRVFTIWVCPDCGHYDADPILKRTEGVPMHCQMCGLAAQRALDLTRINTSYHDFRLREARDSAPFMLPTKVHEMQSGGEES